MRTKQQSPFSHADFWQGNRLPYFVTGGFRQNASGDPMYPVPDSHANCWIILNEVADDHGTPMLFVVGQFVTRDMAQWVCELMLQNRPLTVS